MQCRFYCFHLPHRRLVFDCDSLRLLSFQQQPLAPAQQQRELTEEVEAVRKEAADRNLDIKISYLDIYGAWVWVCVILSELWTERSADRDQIVMKKEAIRGENLEKFHIFCYDAIPKKCKWFGLLENIQLLVFIFHSVPAYYVKKT